VSSVTSQVATLTILGIAILVDDGNLGFRSNQFGFSIFSTPGRPVTVEASTDSVPWATAASILSTNSSFYFSDPDAANYSRRFYRAVLH
jgi:hypothetical protein